MSGGISLFGFKIRCESHALEFDGYERRWVRTHTIGSYFDALFWFCSF